MNAKRIAIYINDERVIAWDPYSRGEKHTSKLDQVLIPLDFKGSTYNVRLQPFILPPQSLYSSNKAHLQASGPGKWNKQQGLYIYRSNRIIQAGGWSGLRTSDEHTKLVRIAMFIPSELDEVFQVNVAKKHANLPRELRAALLQQIQPILHRGQEVYREKLGNSPSILAPIYLDKEQLAVSNKSGSVPQRSFMNQTSPRGSNGSEIKVPMKLESLITLSVEKLRSVSKASTLKELMKDIYNSATVEEQIVFEKFLMRLVSE